jgi:hypothetical protein
MAQSDANKRSGLILFAVYLLAYSAYVIAIGFFPSVMIQIPFPEIPEHGSSPWPSIRGINWAVLSGLCLIVFAVFLALVYSMMCAGAERRFAQQTPAEPQA